MMKKFMELKRKGRNESSDNEKEADFDLPWIMLEYECLDSDFHFGV